ncbi:MAG: hypothetical protein ACREWE_00950 [Gammaproteobacteria bacterium]
MGVYRTTADVPVFHAVRAPTAGELQALLTRTIERLTMKFLTRKGRPKGETQGGLS